MMSLIIPDDLFMVNLRTFDEDPLRSLISVALEVKHRVKILKVLSVNKNHVVSTKSHGTLVRRHTVRVSNTIFQLSTFSFTLNFRVTIRYRIKHHLIAH